jgi:hypothetical protein
MERLTLPTNITQPSPLPAFINLTLIMPERGGAMGIRRIFHHTISILSGILVVNQLINLLSELVSNL